jgi:uncharacterized protein YwqG
LSRLSSANEIRIKALISEFGLAKLEPWIMRHATECILLRVDAPNPSQEKGMSRMGGMPDLPKSVRWPARDDGKLFSHIMQIDLGDLPQLQSRAIPDSGRLYVFVGDDGVSGNVEHRVIYDNSSVLDLARASQPQEGDLASESLLELKPYALIFELSLSLPETAVSEQWRDREIDMNDEVWDKYSEMRATLSKTRGEPPSQLLGYASFFGDDPARTAFYSKIGRMNVEGESLAKIRERLEVWKADGNPLSIAYCEKQEEDYHWYLAHQNEIDAGVNEWQLLLQIQSNKYVGLWWWDAGSVQLMIRKADLSRLRFDNTHMGLFSN